MANRFQVRKGNTAHNDSFVGAVGELSYDTEKKQLRVHDGNVVGGVIIANHKDIDENLLNYLPTPYPKSTPPNGYLALMGQAISQATYPKLYSLYGATLPDLRGQFMRGLDYGRGVDSGRTVLSEQGDAIRNITGSVNAIRMGIGWTPQSTGALLGKSASASGDANSGSSATMTIDIDASRVVPTASENRPKNIAFLYIVKAG